MIMPPPHVQCMWVRRVTKTRPPSPQATPVPRTMSACAATVCAAAVPTLPETLFKQKSSGLGTAFQARVTPSASGLSPGMAMTPPGSRVTTVRRHQRLTARVMLESSKLLAQLGFRMIFSSSTTS